MSTLFISGKCQRCLGTGMDNNVSPSITCVSCGGTGYIGEAKIDSTEMMNELDWLKKKIKKILQKLDIPEE